MAFKAVFIAHAPDTDFEKHHKDVAGILEALENKVAVCVSRGDVPSSKITVPVLQREFFGK